MPIFKENQPIVSPWSELTFFAFEYLKEGEERILTWRGPKERYVAVEGTVGVFINGEKHILERGGYFDPPAGSSCVLTAVNECGGICRCCGDWGLELGGTGLFCVEKSDSPVNAGDPVFYERNASFDNHYHDCDEYWIIYEGGGVAYSEGKPFEVGAGDCVATGRGWHHDFPEAHKPVNAVYFETTLTGQMRLGHLWEHTHGKPLPDPERI